MLWAWLLHALHCRQSAGSACLQLAGEVNTGMYTCAAYQVAFVEQFSQLINRSYLSLDQLHSSL